MASDRATIRRALNTQGNKQELNMSFLLKYFGSNLTIWMYEDAKGKIRKKSISSQREQQQVNDINDF